MGGTAQHRCSLHHRQRGRLHGVGRTTARRAVLQPQSIRGAPSTRLRLAIAIAITLRRRRVTVTLRRRRAWTELNIRARPLSAVVDPIPSTSLPYNVPNIPHARTLYLMRLRRSATRRQHVTHRMIGIQRSTTGLGGRRLPTRMSVDIHLRLHDRDTAIVLAAGGTATKVVDGVLTQLEEDRRQDRVCCAVPRLRSQDRVYILNYYCSVLCFLIFFCAYVLS